METIMYRCLGEHHPYRVMQKATALKYETDTHIQFILRIYVAVVIFSVIVDVWIGMVAIFAGVELSYTPPHHYACGDMHALWLIIYGAAIHCWFVLLGIMYQYCSSDRPNSTTIRIMTAIDACALLAFVWTLYGMYLSYGQDTNDQHCPAVAFTQFIVGYSLFSYTIVLGVEGVMIYTLSRRMQAFDLANQMISDKSSFMV